MTRRRPRLPFAGLVVGFMTVIAMMTWGSRNTVAAEIMVGSVGLVVLVVDAVISFRAVGAPDLAVLPLDDGDVGDEVRLLVTARHRGRPLLASLAGAPARDRFALPAPGTGILRLVLNDPGFATELDVDVACTGPFGLIRTARRVRVPLGAPAIAGPPVFEHLYDPPPVRPVFAGPSPGMPKGVDLTRGVRPYLPGDHRRSVHWNATAHTGTLMVREREGTGAVRVRVVIALTRTGPASVVTAGRANALIRDLVAQGCEVEVVTLEAAGRELAPPAGPYRPPSAERGLPPYQTVARPVTDLTTLRTRLSLLLVGTPAELPSSLPTRLISDAGDRWL